MLTALTLGLHFLASFILSALTLSVAWKRRQSSDSIRSFLLMIGAYAGWTAFSAINRLSGLLVGPTQSLGSIAGMFGTMTGWAVLNFAMRFPENSVSKDEKIILRVTLILSIGMSFLTWLPGFFRNPRIVDDIIEGERGSLFLAVSTWIFLLIFLGYAILIYKRVYESQQPYKSQLTYSLIGMTPAVIFAFVFSFVLPYVSTGLQRFAWIGPATSVFVTVILFVGIAHNGIYDIQTALHKTLFLFFVSSMFVGLIYIPAGVLLSRFLDLDFRTGLLLFLVLFASHAVLTSFFPGIISLILGQSFNPEDTVRQVLSLAANVDRDIHEVCYDVAVLLKLAFRTERIVAVIPAGDRFRIVAPDEQVLPAAAQMTLLQKFNGNYRVTKAIAHFVYYSAADQDIKSMAPSDFGKSRKRVIKYAEGVRNSLVDLGFDVFLPIMNENRLLAVFLLGGKQGNAPFFPSEFATLRIIASALSIALKNVDDYSRIVRVNTALIKESGQGQPPDPIQRIVTVSPDRAIVYRGRVMEQTIQEIEQAAAHDESVLILGETGSGKDLAAHLIHAMSSRKNRPFIAVNCGSLADSLLENELFGHEKGAYTGADRPYEGLFEQAEGGVLFLDEIGEISEALQLRLLRVLEDRKVRRLGGRTVRVNIRIIAATNRDLKDRVERGHFRADLFYRLNVIAVMVPPLRDRKEDIPVLVEHFLKRYSDRFGRPGMRVSPEAMKMLQRNSWPGNIRELENTILRAFVNSRGDVLMPADFPDMSGELPISGTAAGSGLQRRTGEGLDDFLRRMENLLLQDALIRSGGNKAKAARELGLSRTTFYHKLGQMEKAVGS